jgi:hypothetical protein
MSSLSPAFRGQLVVKSNLNMCKRLNVESVLASLPISSVLASLPISSKERQVFRIRQHDSATTSLEILSLTEDKVLATLEMSSQDDNARVVMTIVNASGTDIAVLQTKNGQRNHDNAEKSPQPHASPKQSDLGHLRLYGCAPLYPGQIAKRTRTCNGPLALYLWGELEHRLGAFFSKQNSFVLQVPMHPTAPLTYTTKPGKPPAAPGLRLSFGGGGKPAPELGNERTVSCQGKKCATFDGECGQVTIELNTDPLLMIVLLAATNQLF